MARWLVLLVVLGVWEAGVRLPPASQAQERSATELVGRQEDDATVVPVNQLLTPFGNRSHSRDCARRRWPSRPTADCSPFPERRANC